MDRPNESCEQGGFQHKYIVQRQLIALSTAESELHAGVSTAPKGLGIQSGSQGPGFELVWVVVSFLLEDRHRSCSCRVHVAANSPCLMLLFSACVLCLTWDARVWVLHILSKKRAAQRETASIGAVSEHYSLV